MKTSYKELLTLTKQELLKELEKAKKELLKLGMGIKTDQMKEIHKLKTHKKLIAQILTALREMGKSSENMEKPLAETETKATISSTT